jgi:two-component system, NtrC family, sensor kinase
VIQKTVVYPRFLSLDRDEAVKDLDRAKGAIRRENEHLDLLCYDWAAWDATYKYIEDHNEEYASENLILASFTEAKLNLIYFIDIEGEVVWGEIRNLDTEEIMELKLFPPNRFPKNHPLLRHKSVESHIHGMVMTDSGPMLISSRPILTSDSKGPIRGTILMGRLLTQDLVGILQEQTRVEFRIWPIDSEAVSSEDRLAMGSFSSTSDSLVQVRNDDRLAVYSTITDIDGKPALLIRADISREISAKGKVAMRAAVLSVIAVGAITLLILLFVIQRTVVGPISQLTTHATKIGTNNDLTSVIDLQRTDEIGILANEFDNMVKKLSDSQNQLMQLSRNAGMADVATDVLHNVGNVMNSINVSTTCVAEKIRNSRLAGLSKLADLMRHHTDDISEFMSKDDRGKQLPAYLLQLSDHWEGEQDELLGELGSLAKNLEHVNSIIQAQQSYTQVAAVTEWTSLAQLADNVLTMVAPEFQRHEITINCEIADLPSVPMDRAKVMQILVNLLTNAKKALKSRSKDDRRITLRVRAAGENRVSFEVVDNGIGIPPENTSKIFAEGFTTNRDSRGIGLHYAALAAQEMGCSLTVHSDGPGRGSIFSLELPLKALDQSDTT